MIVRAPGKLILSGEHAVVYGHPALAMAVNRYVSVLVKPGLSSTLSFILAQHSEQYHWPFACFEPLYHRVRGRYQRFISGDIGVRGVLAHPVELAAFSVSLLLETLDRLPEDGIELHIESTLPIGCGMGSSAALILSVLIAVARELHLELHLDDYYRLGLEAEHMQHGRSSGMDVHTSLYGGCLYRHQETIAPRAVPAVPMSLVQTGVPRSSTGECVAAAARFFQTSSIGDDFAAVTHALDAALPKNILSEWRDILRENHKLLTLIGVVPDKIHAFIRAIEHHGGAAKICGAGAVHGDSAGIVLVVMEDQMLLRRLIQYWGFSLLPIQCESRGVHNV